MKPEMNPQRNPRNPLIAIFILIGLLMALPEQVWVGGARAGERAAPNSSRSTVPRTWVQGGTPATRFQNFYQPYYYYYPYPYRFTGYYGQPIVVISPAYYPYYVPQTVVVSSPFYCLAHQAGWVSRAGMLDHLSGTHKIPLATAASVCPDTIESCVVDGY
jgi:hypothetical protein